MDWLSVALALAVLVGAAAGTALVVRSPAFWLGMGGAIFKAAWPALLKLLASSPETQARAREDSRQRNEPGKGHGPER